MAFAKEDLAGKEEGAGADELFLGQVVDLGSQLQELGDRTKRGFSVQGHLSLSRASSCKVIDERRPIRSESERRTPCGVLRKAVKSSWSHRPSDGISFEARS